MQTFKIILVVACLAGIASAASWSQISDHCEHCRKLKEEVQKWSTKVDHDSTTTEKYQEEGVASAASLSQISDHCEHCRKLKEEVQKWSTKVNHGSTTTEKNQEEGIASNEKKVVPKGAITKHLCEKTNLCQRESPLFNLNQKSQGDDMNCDECKEYYDKVKKNLPGLEKAWIELCKQIPSEEKQQECLEDEKTTVDYISKHTSEEVCQHDGLCPPSKRPFIDLAPLQRSIEITKHLCEKTNLCQRESPLFILNQGDDMNCDECKEYVDKVKKNLPELEKMGIEVCKRLEREEDQQKCLEDIKTTIDYISKHTSEEVCQHDGFCPPKRPFFDLAPLHKSMCSLLCEPCKQIAQQLKAGAPQAKDQLKKMCKNCGAPDNVKKCEKAIDKFIENIEKKSPEELCIEIGLCKKQ